MNNPKQAPAGRKPTREVPKPKKVEAANRDEAAPGELLEGEGSVGLSIMGGGGHA